MDQPVVFDSKSAGAIAKTVRKVLGNSGNIAGRRTDKHGDLALIWARISSSALTSGVYYHAWTEQRRTATGFEDVPDDPLTGTTTEWAAILPDKSQYSDITTPVRLIIETISIEGQDDLVVVTIYGAISIGCSPGG